MNKTTYTQSLLSTTKALINWPLSKQEITQFVKSFRIIAIVSTQAILRIVLLLTLPISAPLFTILVRIAERQTIEQQLKAKQDLVDRFTKQLSN